MDFKISLNEVSLPTGDWRWGATLYKDYTYIYTYIMN